MACSHQAPPSMGFSRQEYWSGVPCPPPEDFPDPEIKLTLLGLCIAGRFFTTEPKGKPFRHMEGHLNTPLMFERSSMGKNDRKTAILEKNFIEMRNKKVLKLKIVSKYQE